MKRDNLTSPIFTQRSRKILFLSNGNALLQDVKDYTWCLQVPPRCVTYRTKLVTRFREENVTRVVNVRSCCPGYSPDGKGYCKAVCQESCGAHGHCAEPDVCRCDPGFSGDKCQDVGCPGKY